MGAAATKVVMMPLATDVTGLLFNDAVVATTAGLTSIGAGLVFAGSPAR
jgi:hypothetical protein